MHFLLYCYLRNVPWVLPAELRGVAESSKYLCLFLGFCSCILLMFHVSITSCWCLDSHALKIGTFSSECYSFVLPLLLCFCSLIKLADVISFNLIVFAGKDSSVWLIGRETGHRYLLQTLSFIMDAFSLRLSFC